MLSRTIHQQASLTYERGCASKTSPTHEGATMASDPPSPQKRSSALCCALHAPKATTGFSAVCFQVSQTVQRWQGQSLRSLKIVAACIPHQNIIRSFIIERNADLGPERFALKNICQLKKKNCWWLFSLNHKVVWVEAGPVESWRGTPGSPPSSSPRKAQDGEGMSEVGSGGNVASVSQAARCPLCVHELETVRGKARGRKQLRGRLVTPSHWGPLDCFFFFF